MKKCKCPVWIKFLGKIFGQNRTAINSLQKILSHAINGHNEKLPHVIFLKEQKILDESGLIVRKIKRPEKKDIYGKYKQWCENNGNSILARNRFYTLLRSHGLIIPG